MSFILGFGQTGEMNPFSTGAYQAVEDCNPGLEFRAGIVVFYS